MNKTIATLSVVVIVGAVMIGAKILMAPKPVHIDPQMARAEGNSNAKVKIVEFVDFQCPACAYGLEFLKTFFARHPNDLYLQIKYFPLTNMHHHALLSALYSECAARQGKFWALDDLMIPQQSQWAQLVNPQPVFDSMAQQVGMNKDQLQACLGADGTRQAIYNEKSLGQSLGVASTPTYFINNKMVVGVKSLQDELKNYFSDVK